MSYWIKLAEMFGLHVGDIFQVVDSQGIELSGTFCFRADGLYYFINGRQYSGIDTTNSLIQLLNGKYTVERRENE